MQVFSKLFLKGPESDLQVFRSLFTESVEVKAVQKGQEAFIKVLQSSSQPGARGAGIVDGMTFLSRALRIDPQAYGFSRFFARSP